VGAARAGGFTDRSLTALAMIGVSTPVFLLGALMLYFLAYKLSWFPNGGYVPLTSNPGEWLYHMILPWLALSALFIGIYSRVLRSNVLDTMSEDYVRTAKAKGLPERRILFHHVLRNSVISIVALCDSHRVGLQPPRGRPVCGAVDRGAGRAPGARDRHVRVVLRRAAECHHRRRDGAARPPDQAPIAARATARRG